ncbi:MAG TPA: hypothetical protein VMU15_11370 [Anaeromyxobacter sp.]|nr:hypothetical protein [Anaeromyxobacter sp.]
MADRNLVVLVAWATAACLWAGAAPGKEPAARDEAASDPPRDAREIVLDEKASGRVFAVRTARNVVTVVEFPEDLVGLPACGDCEDGQGPEGDALYRMEAVARGRYLTLRPNPVARRARESDPVTTILVRMEHATLTLYVEQVERGRADTRVVFTYPNRSADDEYLRVERAKLELEAAARAEAALTARFLRSFAEPHRCVSKSARVRSDDLVLEVREMCYFGREVIITLEVENRGRDPLEVGSVVVNRGSSKREYLSEKTIEGDRPSTAVVALHLEDGEQVRGPYAVTLQESGGRGRVVAIDHLEF